MRHACPHIAGRPLIRHRDTDHPPAHGHGLANDLPLLDAQIARRRYTGTAVIGLAR